jgi:hypothetical protein
MHKVVNSFMVMLAVLVVLPGCGSATGYVAQDATSNSAPTQLVVSNPILNFWIMGDRPMVSGDGFTFAAHLMYFDGAKIIVIYTLSGPNAVKPLDGKLVYFTDEGGELAYQCYPARPPGTQRPPADQAPTQTARPYPPQMQTERAYPAPTLIPLPTLTLPPYPVATQPLPTPCTTPVPFGSIVTPLAQLGQLQIGAVTSGPRVTTSGREIHVLLDLAAGTQPMDVFVAKVVGPEGMTPPGSANRAGYLDQSGYRVSYNGYDFTKGDRVAEVAQGNNATGVAVTEKPIPVMATEAAAAASWTPQPPGATSTRFVPTTEALAFELAGGKPIRSQATLRIEDLASKVPQYLFIIFLMDGSVKATLVQ